METLVQGCYIGHEVVTYKGSQPRRWSSLSPALTWTVSARGGDPSSFIHLDSGYLSSNLHKDTVYASKDLFFFFFFFRAIPAAYGSSQARGKGSNWSCHRQPIPQPQECQDLSHVYNLHHSSRQRHILNPPSEARDWTYIFMDTSRVRNLLCHNRNSRDHILIKLSSFPSEHLSWFMIMHSIPRLFNAYLLLNYKLY